MAPIARMATMPPSPPERGLTFSDLDSLRSADPKKRHRPNFFLAPRSENARRPIMRRIPPNSHPLLHAPS